MIGRRVKHWYYGLGTVMRWAPLDHAMTDTLVEHESGQRCWYSSRDLQPADGQGPLPSRAAAQAEENKRMRQQLVALRTQLIEAIERGPRWPGCEFGKAHLGRAVDAALKEIEKS